MCRDTSVVSPRVSSRCNERGPDGPGEFPDTGVPSSLSAVALCLSRGGRRSVCLVVRGSGLFTLRASYGRDTSFFFSFLTVPSRMSGICFILLPVWVYILLCVRMCVVYTCVRDACMCMYTCVYVCVHVSV